MTLPAGGGDYASPTGRCGAMMRAALGFRAMKGGSVVVGVTVDDAGPQMLVSTFLATAAEGDRLALEPYHVAYELAQGTDDLSAARAAIESGRKRQDALAGDGLSEIVGKMRAAGHDPLVAALLVNRAGWIADLLSYSLAFADHPPVAEGLAVRDAIRLACDRAGIAVIEVDEKSLEAGASESLGLPPAEIASTLKALGTAAGKPWRKEQKHACLAAWAAAR